MKFSKPMKAIFRYFIGFFVLGLLTFTVIVALFLFKLGGKDFTVNPINFSKDTLTIVAYDPRYACGDWVDDLTVVKVNDTIYNNLLQNDIDPYLSYFKTNTPDLIKDFIWQDYASEDTSTWNTGLIELIGFAYNEKNCAGCSNATTFKILSMKMLNTGRAISFE